MKKYGKLIIFGLILLTLLVLLCFVPIRVSKLIPLVEDQVQKDYGVKVHIERLILRVGPSIKIKAPVMHLMYEDGQKFAQFDNVKFYIPWKSFIRKSPVVKHIQAKKLSIRVLSDDVYFNALLNNLQQKSYNDIPSIYLKEYNFSYLNKGNSDKYLLTGESLEINKINAYQNYKLKTKGSFSINSNKYISYDLILDPNLRSFDSIEQFDIINLINQIKDLDFYSDIIADVKFYRNKEDVIQASGFVNVDNISVLDKTRKGPKSFIYMTLWGDKASLLSNIYTSINDKICIEGMINNSKKPVLDLKVKTDKIDISDLYNKLKLFMHFSQIKDINSISGTLNANFTLKGNLNKIKSNGYLKISNASVKANGLLVNKIDSEIDFSNNNINIVKAVGLVNNSPIIVKGCIDKNINLEVLMNKVELKYLCPSSWGVKSGIASILAKYSGTLDDVKHKENLLIENLNIENDLVNSQIGSIEFDTNKSNTAYIKNIVCKTKETEQIKIPSMKMDIDSNTIRIPETNIYMPNSMLKAKGDIVNYNNSNINFVASLEGFINSKDLMRFSKFSTRYPVLLTITGNKSSQNINSQIFFEKTDLFDEPMILNLISKFERKSIKIEDLSLITINGRFSENMKNNLKGIKKLSVTGSIEDFNKPTMKNIRVFIPQLLNLQILDTLIQIKGDLFVNGEFTTPEIVGQLFIQNLFNQSLQLSIQNCSADFNKNNVILNAPTVKFVDSTMGINALVSNDISKSIIVKTLNIKSKYLNTDTFLMYKDAPIMKLLPIKILDGKFYSERILSNIYGSSLYLSGTTFDFKLDDNIITAKNLMSELFNGKISGAFDYNLRDEHFNTKLMARSVSAEPVFSIISKRKDSISGTMDFDANLLGELTSKTSLNGNIKFIVHNGRMSTLGKLEHLLYAQNVIADNMLRTSLSVVTKAITLKDTGLFKYLRGDVDLENGVANIKLLQSQGPLMSLFIKGLYNPMTDYANLVVLGRLSDEIISGLGIFGDFSLNKLIIMLTGEESNSFAIAEDFDKIPQLPSKYTKEFRSIINGNIDKTSSVRSFNWISYSKKSLKQKEIPMTNTKLPEFVESLPY